MAQFDVHRNADRDQSRLFPFLVDVQHPLHRQLESRVVIPLTLSENLDGQPLRGLNPMIEVGGKEYVLLTQQLSAIPMTALGPKVPAVGGHRDAVFAALDLLISGV
jgi:toxin CcdB